MYKPLCLKYRKFYIWLTVNVDFFSYVLNQNNNNLFCAYGPDEGKKGGFGQPLRKKILFYHEGQKYNYVVWRAMRESQQAHYPVKTVHKAFLL